MKKRIKNVLKRNFSSLAFFYKHLKYRLPLLLLISILVGLLDGLGLAMFLPMLQMVNDHNAGAAGYEQMGNLAFIARFINNIGFDLTLPVVLMTILILFCFKGIFHWLEQYLMVIFRQFFARTIRLENIAGLANYKYNAFIKADAGRIQNSLSGEVARVVNAYAFYSQMLQKVILVSTYSALAFFANPEFAALVFIGGGVTNFLFRTLYRRTKSHSSKLTTLNHSFQGLLIQQVAFFKYLKATGLVKKYADNLKRRVEDIEQVQKQIGILNSIMFGVREPLMIGVVVAVILIQVTWRGGDLGLILLSILFFYRALTSVMMLQSLYNNFLSFSGSLDDLQAFTKELKQAKEHQGGTPYQEIKKEIILKDIYFAFEETPVLDGINLSIKKNETIALVGESGSGKTTLMNIMTALLTPQQGHVLIDNLQLEEMDAQSFQKKVGYITQEPVIFDDTIYNNVTFWDEKNEKNLHRFYQALEKASIDLFVSQQTNKEETRLGNNGVNLSGGQKQRISIARELYKDIDILFMDEATSALDSETEKSIQDNINKLKGEYTIIIIAHRLSTIKDADKVVILSKGKVEHIGKYEEVIQKSHSFKRMVKLQEL